MNMGDLEKSARFDGRLATKLQSPNLCIVARYILNTVLTSEIESEKNVKQVFSLGRN